MEPAALLDHSYFSVKLRNDMKNQVKPPFLMMDLRTFNTLNKENYLIFKVSFHEKEPHFPIQKIKDVKKQPTEHPLALVLCLL